MENDDLISDYEDVYFYVGQFLSQYISQPDRPHGLSYGHFLVLKGIAADENCLMTNLATRLKTSQSTVVSELKRLLKLGLVRQVENLADRRQKFLQLTDEGVTVLAELQAEHAQLFDHMVEQVGYEEAKQFIQTIKKARAVLAAS